MHEGTRRFLFAIHCWSRRRCNCTQRPCQPESLLVDRVWEGPGAKGRSAVGSRSNSESTPSARLERGVCPVSARWSSWRRFQTLRLVGWCTITPDARGAAGPQTSLRRLGVSRHPSVGALPPANPPAAIAGTTGASAGGRLPEECERPGGGNPQGSTTIAAGLTITGTPASPPSP